MLMWVSLACAATALTVSRAQAEALLVIDVESGKVLYAQRGKRHGMIKRTNKQIRNLRGTAVMFKTDGDNVIKYFLPNG